MYKPTQQQVNLGKIPPQNIELEETVLGAIILESKCLETVSEIITSPDVFYKETHQAIYNAILTLKEKGSQIDLVVISEELKAQGKLEQVGGIYELTRLTMNVLSSAHVESHSRILMEKYFGREMIRICSKAIQSVYSDDEEIFDNIEIAEKEIYELTSNNVGKPVEHIRQEVQYIEDEINYKIEHKIEFNGVPTGFYSVDQLTGGWQNTDIIILAARTSVGKTALALNLAFNAATNVDKPSGVAFFSLEMSRKQITERLISMSSNVKLDRIKKPLTLESYDFTNMSQANIKLKTTPIYIDDTPAISVPQVAAKLRQLIKKHDIKLAIIDYLQLMRGSQLAKGNREQEVAKISRDLKEVAMDLNIPIIALSQLNRKVEYRESKKPTMADLRESGGIENDASIIMLCYNANDDAMEENPELKNMILIDFAKNRSGATDEVILFKDLSVQKFQDQPFEGYYQPNPFNGIRRDITESNKSDLPF